MKILYVITGLGMGGAENQVANIIDKMVLLGHQVELISITGETIVKPCSKSVAIHELKMNKSPFSIVLSLIKLIKLIKRYEPDVIHSHMVHANILLRLVRIITPIKKLINTAHSNYEGGRVLMFLYKYSNFLTDYFTNVSKDAVNTFKLKNIVKQGQMFCIHNGIDLNKFYFSSISRERLRIDLNIEAETKLLLAVGSFNKAKDYPNLLMALKKLLIDTKNVHLIIAGDGPLKEQIVDMIDNLELKKFVSLLGIRNDIPALMSASDIFILSSEWEGFGLVVAEAMACETPVVATDCGGVKEVLGGFGHLVAPKNSESLAKEILKIINIEDAELKNLKSLALKHVSETYSLDSITNKWLTMYEK